MASWKACLVAAAALAFASVCTQAQVVPANQTGPVNVTALYANIPYNNTPNITYDRSFGESQTVALGGGQKWAWCGFNGRNNLRFAFNSTRKIWFAVATPAQVQSCDASKAAKCAVIDNNAPTFDNKTSGDATSWGEVAGREKCLFAINAYSTNNATFKVHAHEYSPGSWAAINFGVAITTIVLVAAIIFGCYYDVKKVRQQYTSIPPPPTRSPYVRGYTEGIYESKDVAAPVKPAKAPKVKSPSGTGENKNPLAKLFARKPAPQA